MRSLAIFLVATACGTKGLPPQVVADLAAHVDATEREANEHASVALAATTTESALALEDGHWNRINNEFIGMRSDLEMMSVCHVNGGGQLMTDEMHDALQDVQAERDRHEERMRTSATLAQMQDEERRHQGAMLASIADARSQQAKLVHTPDVLCP